MRKIRSAAAYESAWRAIPIEELWRAAEIVVEAAKELMGNYGLHRAVFLCEDTFLELGTLAAKELDAPVDLLSQDELRDLSGTLVCDLLFAAAPKEALAPKRARWIRTVHQAGCPVLSVAIPAGVDPDTGRAEEFALCSQITLAIDGYLPGLFLHDGLDHCGEIMPFGGDGEAGEALYRFEAPDAQRLLPPRKRTAHKGDSGKALLCVGSMKYIGAALLSARACLAAGCGILYVACPDEVRRALWQLPEAIGIPVGPEWDKTTCEIAIRAMAGMKAVGLGCGVGDGDVSPLIEAALGAKGPLVLDADGLNCLSRHPELCPLLHEQVILTPHPGEMARLTGLPIDRVLDDPVGIARRYARQWGCQVLLKGAATVVSDGKRTCLVAEGNAGLGKGGSGDVLTGIITGLLAQGVEPYGAACLGSYLLGTSAEKAFALLRERVLRATDVIEALKDGNE